MRRLLFAAASLVLVLILVALARDTGGGAFVRAFLANLAVVTWSSFVLPLRGLPRLDEYFTLRAWEQSGRFYRALGVPLFRAMVRRGPLAMFNRRLPAAWHSHRPDRVEHEARAAEAGHLVAFLIVVALAVLAFVRGQHAEGAWLLALDIPANLYPVLLQRYHRLRLADLVRTGEWPLTGAPHV